MQVRRKTIEDKLDLEEIENDLPVEVSTNIENQSLIDDYHHSRQILRDMMKINKDVVELVSTELKTMPSNVKLGEVCARLFESATNSSEKLMRITQILTDIYKGGKEKDEGMKTANIQNAIFVGSLSDVLKLKQGEVKKNETEIQAIAS